MRPKEGLTWKTAQVTGNLVGLLAVHTPEIHKSTEEDGKNIHKSRAIKELIFLYS